MPMYEVIEKVENKDSFILKLYGKNMPNVISACGLNVKGREVNETEVQLCLAAIPLLFDLEYCRHKKTTHHVFSYTLKHIVEKFVGHYISNGAAIKACLTLGIEVVKSKDIGRNISPSPNCFFRMKAFSSRQLQSINIDLNIKKLVELLGAAKCSTNTNQTVS